METVQLTLPKRDVALAMQEMRSWLDGRRFEPLLFNYRISSEQAHVKVKFANGREAVAFAERFAGRLDPVG